MKREPRTGQEHLEDEILDILSDGRVRETAEINRSVRLRVPPTSADNQRAGKRPNETKYDQIVANALQANRTLSRTGLIRRTDVGTFEITIEGRERAKARRKEQESMGEILDRLFLDDAN